MQGVRMAVCLQRQCPKNRFARTADGEPGLNYLCAGYHKFFSHAAPYMDFMKNELMNRRPLCKHYGSNKKQCHKAISPQAMTMKRESIT